jgi:predicted aminopeptidase
LSRSPRLGFLPFLLLPLALGGCYALQSAAGHADLLARRKPIAKVLKDPRTTPQVRARLETVLDARQFAFQALGLKKSGDFTSYAAIDRPVVTYLVSGSKRVSLEAYEWSFPFVGRFPYKGYFKRERAAAERDRLEAMGWDASIGGASAYKTPLPFSDPLPSSALDASTGAVAALIIHELAHGTVYFKNKTEFDEALAQFVGQEGARRFLAERYGKDSREFAAYAKELDEAAAAGVVMTVLRSKLEALYASQIPDAQKLERRKPLFEAAKKDLDALGWRYPYLNNAVVVAHGVYHADLPFAALLAKHGGDFPKFVAALKSLDPKDPAGDLRSKAR